MLPFLSFPGNIFLSLSRSCLGVYTFPETSSFPFRPSDALQCNCNYNDALALLHCDFHSRSSMIPQQITVVPQQIPVIPQQIPTIPQQIPSDSIADPSDSIADSSDSIAECQRGAEGCNNLLPHSCQGQKHKVQVLRGPVIFLFFFKRLWRYYYLCVYMDVCVSICHMFVGPRGDQQRAQDPWT